MAGTDLQPESYRFLQNYVYRESGIVLDGDKQYLLEARLMPIMQSLRLGSLNDLCTVLGSPNHDSLLKRQVVDAMTTNETFFFRDPAQYDALRSIVLPALIAQRQDTRRLSFWSAASSSGQEAYSLAMMLLEMGLGDWRIKIQGTDLSTKMVDRARAGRYLQIEVNRGLPASCLIKYFTRAGLEWQLKDEVRRLVEFSVFDLREHMSALGPFDLVFCRNVLIYFDMEVKRRILNEIHGTLFRGGYLLLGGSETTLNLTNRFDRQILGQSVFYQAP
ncbi:MAG TPA: protein-glutamate O-methyltransferase CheR [Bryobacteraceae bacterium]|nr:protein-glutamate O-methyltransferase CheR [Bryobacteraceae bacterium]